MLLSNRVNNGALMIATTTSDKLFELRQLIDAYELDYYYVPSADPHLNEYLPTHWQRRRWLTEFTGSAGDALIAADGAYLWTDPRYFIQAEQELDPAHFQLMRNQQGMAPPIEVWLSQQGRGKVCGVDPNLISIAQAQRWQKTLADKDSELSAIEDNLVDSIWEDQPPLQTKPIHIQSLEFAGKSVRDKLNELRRAIRSLGAKTHIITMLDAIAWLFNIRGRDIHYNPLVISYAIITEDQALLFTNLNRLSESDHHYFKEQGITPFPYQQFENAVSELTDSVLIDPTTTSWAVLKSLQQAEPIWAPSPITLTKACKNPTEQQVMREAHRRDAISLCRFLHWLDSHWSEQTEYTAATKLSEFRKEDPHCVDLSFATISAYADHGAIIHYQPTLENAYQLSDQSLYLLDSGGQYYEGTTDVTRTLHFGTPTEQQKHDYTLVLKSQLALRHTLFPKGTCGEDLNAIAHRLLWQDGLDFGHGTGHGVGCHLCVHEGPQRISSAKTSIPLLPGMIVSNEPGVYFTNQYGIRIENVCLITQAKTQAESRTGHGPFYQFEDLTMVPYERKLINKDELTHEELEQINQYHQHIFQLLNADLSEETRQWLATATLPL